MICREQWWLPGSTSSEATLTPHETDLVTSIFRSTCESAASSADWRPSPAREARALHVDGFDHHAWLRAEAMRFVKGRSVAISPTPGIQPSWAVRGTHVYTIDDLNQLPAFARHGDKDFGW
jgi:hypothetical protein